MTALNMYWLLSSSHYSPSPAQSPLTQHSRVIGWHESSREDSQHAGRAVSSANPHVRGLNIRRLGHLRANVNDCALRSSRFCYSRPFKVHSLSKWSFVFSAAAAATEELHLPPNQYFFTFFPPLYLVFLEGKSRCHFLKFLYVIKE